MGHAVFFSFLFFFFFTLFSGGMVSSFAPSPKLSPVHRRSGFEGTPVQGGEKGRQAQGAVGPGLSVSFYFISPPWHVPVIMGVSLVETGELSFFSPLHFSVHNSQKIP